MNYTNKNYNFRGESRQRWNITGAKGFQIHDPVHISFDKSNRCRLDNDGTTAIIIERYTTLNQRFTNTHARIRILDGLLAGKEYSVRVG